VAARWALAGVGALQNAARRHIAARMRSDPGCRDTWSASEIVSPPDAEAQRQAGDTHPCVPTVRQPVPVAQARIVARTGIRKWGLSSLAGRKSVSEICDGRVPL